jgi:hypothetical protein
MGNLKISGSTTEITEWDIKDILTDKSKDQTICDMIQSDWDNKISSCGLTYLEIEQLNNY